MATSNDLQLFVIKFNCCATTQQGNSCKKSGTCLMNDGKYYCWLHQRIKDKTFKRKPKDDTDFIKIDSKNDECSICYNVLCDPHNIAITNCNHVFHFDCLDKWQNVQVSFSKTCPICRKRMTILRSSSKRKKVVMTNMDVKVKIRSL